MNETTHENDDDEELPDELLDTVEQVVEFFFESSDDHRDANEDAERYLVGEVFDRLPDTERGRFDPEQVAEAVRDETGGGPPTTDEVRQGVADAVRDADAGIALYVSFDDDGNVEADSSARWLDEERMNEAEILAAASLLRHALDDLDVPGPDMSLADEQGGSGGISGAMAVPAGALGGMLGGMSGDETDDEPPEFGGFA